MFEPKLKDSGWENIKESIFIITGENYKESKFDGLIVKELENGYLREHNYSVSKTENFLLTEINNNLMELLWEPLTVSELKNFLEPKLQHDEINIISFRLEYTQHDSIGFLHNPEIIYGWVHYKEDKKIKTLRFSIGLDGLCQKC